MKKVTYRFNRYMKESCLGRMLAAPSALRVHLFVRDDGNLSGDDVLEATWELPEGSDRELPKSWASLVSIETLPVEDDVADDNDDTGLANDEALAWFEQEDWQRFGEWVTKVRKVVNSEVTCLNINVYDDVTDDDAETLKRVLNLIFPGVCIFMFREI